MNAHRCIFQKHMLIAIAVLAIGLAMVMACPAVALAADSSSSASSDSSEAASASAQSPKVAVEVEGLGGLPMMGDDYVWFGKDLKLDGASVGNDLIAAGQTAVVADCSISGDVRAAGENVEVRDSRVGENITMSGQKVVVSDSTAKAVALAGQKASFSGSCDDLTIYAETVFIDGTVEGDVVVGANTVEVGTNARIKGTLYVDASSDPVMQRGAEVGDVKFTQVEGASSADVEGAMAAFALSMSIFFKIIGVIGTFVAALLAEWLFRRQTAGAAGMIRTRTGATIGTGVVGAIVAPIVVLVFICLGVTLPVAIGLMFALFAMTAVAGGFMGASLFKLAFPKLGRFKCAMAGGAIVGIASAIPFLGGIVQAAAFMYLLGYVLQSIFLGMRDPGPAVPAGQTAPTTPGAPTMPNVPPASYAPPMQGAPVVPPASNTQAPPPNGTF